MPVGKDSQFGVMSIVESSVEVRFDTYSTSTTLNSSFEGTVYVLEL